MKQEAFECFYKKYKNLMFYAANQLLRDEFLAEDAVAEAFIKIYQNFDKWFGEDNTAAKNLAVRITKNCAIDMLRKDGRKELVELSE